MSVNAGVKLSVYWSCATYIATLLTIDGPFFVTTSGIIKMFEVKQISYD